MSVAVPWALPSVPVTVCVPITLDVHTAPVQEPPPLIVKVVFAVRLPRLTLWLSKPVAVYVWVAPE